jgi:hypothetical protein
MLFLKYSIMPLRRDLVVILVVLLLFMPIAAGAEMITGKVISRNDEQSSVILELDNGETIAILTPDLTLPHCVIEGQQVRVWGDFSADKTTFDASDIRGPGRNKIHDPTGVRFRLGKGSNQHKPAFGSSTRRKGRSRRHRRR